MLFTKLYLSVNCLIFLLPIVIPPSLQIGKVFCKYHGLYIPLVNFNLQKLSGQGSCFLELILEKFQKWLSGW